MNNLVKVLGCVGLSGALFVGGVASSKLVGPAPAGEAVDPTLAKAVISLPDGSAVPEEIELGSYLILSSRKSTYGGGPRSGQWEISPALPPTRIKALDNGDILVVTGVVREKLSYSLAVAKADTVDTAEGVTWLGGKAAPVPVPDPIPPVPPVPPAPPAPPVPPVPPAPPAPPVPPAPIPAPTPSIDWKALLSPPVVAIAQPADHRALIAAWLSGAYAEVAKAPAADVPALNAAAKARVAYLGLNLDAWKPVLDAVKAGLETIPITGVAATDLPLVRVEYTRIAAALLEVAK